MKNSQQTVIVRRSLLSEGLWLILLFLTCGIAFWATALLPYSVQDANISGWKIPIPFFGLVPLLIIFRITHNLLDVKYLITESYLLSIQGLLSFSRRELRLDFENIRGIELKESLYQRLLNLGNLKVDSSTTEMELLMDGIRRPHAVRDLIEERIRQYCETAPVKNLKARRD